MIKSLLEPPNPPRVFSIWINLIGTLRYMSGYHKKQWINDIVPLKMSIKCISIIIQMQRSSPSLPSIHLHTYLYQYLYSSKWADSFNFSHASKSIWWMIYMRHHTEITIYGHHKTAIVNNSTKYNGNCFTFIHAYLSSRPVPPWEFIVFIFFSGARCVCVGFVFWTIKESPFFLCLFCPVDSK